jgi:hypothetical protein
MTDDRFSRLKSCYTGVMHDVLRAMGQRNLDTPTNPFFVSSRPTHQSRGFLGVSIDVGN